MLINHRLRGFSLVELSIVLVILGVLVGGVLSGQSLIRAAERRSIIIDTTKYLTVYNSFKDKYNAMPGDMTIATQFWGTDATGCPISTDQTPKKETCNGNGDGRIYDNTATTNKYTEGFRAWQHLANAGLIEGIYSGNPAGGSQNTATPGVNSPRSRYSNELSFGFVWSDVASADPNLFDQPPATYLRIGADSDIDDPAIYAEDAWNIDTKVDDGRPAFGRVRAQRNRSACVTTTVEETSNYLLQDTTRGCNLRVLMN